VLITAVTVGVVRIESEIVLGDDMVFGDFDTGMCHTAVLAQKLIAVRAVPLGIVTFVAVSTYDRLLSFRLSVIIGIVTAWAVL
jgi:hypothetical protein